jgi:hypothetical protein
VGIFSIETVRSIVFIEKKSLVEFVGTFPASLSCFIGNLKAFLITKY